MISNLYEYILRYGSALDLDMFWLTSEIIGAIASLLQVRRLRVELQTSRLI